MIEGALRGALVVFKGRHVRADRRFVVAAPTVVLPRGSGRRAIAARVDSAATRLLAGIVAVSFAVRLVVGWLRATPNYFPDEYLYSELGRSLVESGRPLVRGVELGSPALLQPLLTAPAWLIDDVEVSYRLVQGFGALAMSLAAVPAFLLARRVGVARPLALGVAVFAVAIPDLLFASWLIAEPFAYPLVLAAATGVVAAIAEPSRRNGLLVVLWIGLAMFARFQFVVLPLCFLAALLIVGLRERRLRSVLREQTLTLGIFGGAVLVAGVVGFGRILGLYRSAFDGRADPVELAERIGLNALVLAHSSGWILLPGALLGLTLALGRPRSRAETAFAAFAAAVVAAVFLQASLVGAVDQAQERYVFYVLPFAAVAFCLYAGRGWPGRPYHALAATALVAASATVPLAGFTAAEGKAHSPLLLGAWQIETWLESPASGSLALAAAAAVLCAAAVVLTLRTGTAAVALGLAVVMTSVVSAAAVTFDQHNSAAVRANFLPADPSWIDRLGVQDVTLVRSAEGLKTAALEQLFWNRSIDRVVRLPGAEEVDHVGSPAVRIASDGSLMLGRKPVRGALLVDGYANAIRLADADLVATSSSFALWRSHARARLATVAAGLFSDGWLSALGRLYVWPDRPGGALAGSLRFTLTAPEAGEPMTMRFGVKGGSETTVRLLPGVPTSVELVVCSRGPWHAGFVSSGRGFVGSRVVSARATVPRFVPGGCRSHRPAATRGEPA